MSSIHAVMNGFAIFMIALGVFEVASNLYHLTRGSAGRIAASARKQHGEIPADSPDAHFVAKAVIMMGIGLLFTVASLINVPFALYLIFAC